MEQPIYGNKQERQVYHDVMLHYQTARQDLEQRITDWNKKDELFRSYIDEKNWPYRALVFDPRIFTALYEKTARLLANKPRGRMNPREGGDALGAKINNEILNFQWDENERVESTPMLAKWALMDLNARKYGGSFGLGKWRYEKSNGKVIFDGPDFRALDNRNCLANPSYSTVKNWFQYREYLTFQELESVNDIAKSKPIYKNLDFLRQAMDKESERGGDRRDTNFLSRNKSIKGLEDFLGTDSVYRTIEIITEYRPDRWIVFSPKHGVILRDIPNPYHHEQIPIVQLKYYPIDDDIYGLSEIEPVEKLQKMLNALVCQYADAINMSLYNPIKINQTNGAVQMHTLQFGPGAKWLMNDPSKDVMEFQSNPSGVTEFVSTYRFIVGAMQEALGETSAAVSNLVPGQEGKTATEVKDLASSRSARDNFNRIFLEEAIKKQMMLWFKLNQQFFFNSYETAKVIRIVGKDAIRYFQETGLDANGLSDQAIDDLTDPELMNSVEPSDLESPLYPVEVGGETVPKLVMEEDNQTGSLLLEPNDLAGNYDYIPDVGSMSDSANKDTIDAKLQAITLLQQPAVLQLLAQEQKKPKLSDLLIDYFEDIGFKNADQYFEAIQPMEGGMLNGQGQTGQSVSGGAGGFTPGQPDMANGGVGRLSNGFQAVSQRQNQPVVS